MAGSARDGEVTILVFDLVGGPICVSTDDGQIVYGKIAPLIREGHKVIASFEGVEILVPAFLSSAIGRLYGEFTDEQIREALMVRDMPTGGMDTLEFVTEHAKAYFENQEAYRRALKEVMEEEDWQ